jgi:hypothetical protein
MATTKHQHPAPQPRPLTLQQRIENTLAWHAFQSIPYAGVDQWHRTLARWAIIREAGLCAHDVITADKTSLLPDESAFVTNLARTDLDVKGGT